MYFLNYKNPLSHNCNIKYPKCNHTYPYDFKIEDMKKTSHNKGSDKNSYGFLTYLICKNPLCNYDIEIKGKIVTDDLNTPDLIKVTSIK